MWSVIALLTYVLSPRAQRERRAPVAPVAWVMGLALLPYLVLPLDLAFGRRKLKGAAHQPVVGTNAQWHWAAALLDSFGLPSPAPA